MPRLASIVMVFIFVLLPLAGCGSSSLLEAKTPAPEAIKIVEDYMANLLKESNDKLAYARKGNDHISEYEKKIDQKGTWKRKQLSDAEKFIGISEEWEFTNVYLQRERRRYTEIINRQEIYKSWEPWKSWDPREFQRTVIKVKGEWKTKFGDGSIR